MKHSQEEMKLTMIDVHNDPLDVCVVLDPEPWGATDEGALIRDPVVYLTGDFYALPGQARKLADHLTQCADRLDALALERDRP